MTVKSSNIRKALDELAEIISEYEFDDDTRLRLLKIHGRLSEELDRPFKFELRSFAKMLYSPIGISAGVITILSALWAIFSF